MDGAQGAGAGIEHTPRVPAEAGSMKILVGIDGSQQSDKALERAIDEASCKHADLLLVSVAEMLSTLSLFRDELSPEAMERLMSGPKKIAASAEKQAREKGVEPHCFIEPGRPAEVIVDIARREGVDVIVVGSIGKDTVGRLLLGSVSSRLVEIAPCTVVIVR
jgi:nucleotide-binding universal stress UspA family protein